MFARKGGWRKGVPNLWKAQTLPRSLELWRKSKELGDGGMEWGREYEWKEGGKGVGARHRMAFWVLLGIEDTVLKTMGSHGG